MIRTSPDTENRIAGNQKVMHYAWGLSKIYGFCQNVGEVSDALVGRSSWNIAEQRWFLSIFMTEATIKAASP